MNQKVSKFLEFNGKTLLFLSNEGEYFVALKPVCEAIGVNYKNAHEALLKDPILSQLSSMHGVVAADGRLRKMVCLSEKYIYGWLFSLQSKAPSFLEFKKECYEVLYNHFHGTITGRKELLQQRAELKKAQKEILEKLQNDPDYITYQELHGKDTLIGKALAESDREIIKEQLSLNLE